MASSSAESPRGRWSTSTIRGRCGMRIDRCKNRCRRLAAMDMPVQVTADALAARVRAESVDLAASRVVARAGEPVALALVARRGWTSRLAAIGVVRGARRTGAGWFAVGHMLDEARARGDRRVVLEVIETNAPAVRLYERAGFAATRRLVGFRAEIGRAAGRG